MKSDVKQKWLEALREGSYRQCQGRLKTPGKDGTRTKYCCLGVLTNIYIKETGKVKWCEITGSVVLPPEVRRWAGLNRSNPVVPLKGYTEAGLSRGRGHLAELNDDGYSFKQIADLIEKHIPG